MKKCLCSLLLTFVVSLPVIADVNLFSDSFDRSDNADIDAVSIGMSGTIGPMPYVERDEVLHANIAEALLLTNIENNTLHVADGPNMSVLYLDHNFTDSAITAAGGMKIGMTIVSNDGTLVDGGRYFGFGVGSTQTEASTAQFDFTVGATSTFRGSVAASTPGHSDFYVGWNTANGGYLEVFENGPSTMGGEHYTIGGFALTGNDRLELELAVSDFNSGSTVYANILWNSTVVHTTSFQWGYSNANFIGITARQNAEGFTIDNLEVIAASVQIPSVLLDFTSTPDTVDRESSSSTVTLSWNANGILPGMTYAVTADKPVVFPNSDNAGMAVDGQTSILANVDGTLGDIEFTVTLLNNSQPITSQTTIVEAASVPDPDAPNVIVILMDDTGWSDIGCYGSEIQTPNIDSLAAEGVRFRNFYQAARCSPTRIALMTGLYTQQAAIDPGASLPNMKDHGLAGANNVTIAEVLKDEGYRTYMAGKWHLGLTANNRDPISRGFMHVFGCGVNADQALDGGPFGSWTESSYNLVSTDNEIPKREYAAQGLQFHTSDAIGDYSVDFIDHHVRKGDGRPFFLYMPFIAAHWPINAPAELANKYTDVGDPNPEDEDVCLYEQGWDVIRQQKYDRQLAMGVIDSRFTLSPRGDHPEPPTEIPAWDTLDTNRKLDLARRQAVYAAMLDQADSNIGKVITKLTDEGLLNNTLIFLCFDNGANYEGGLFGNTTDPSGVVWDPSHLDSMGQPQNAENEIYPRVNQGGGWANVSNTPFRLFKHFTHEGGIRTAGILYWPAATDPSVAGTWTEERGHLIDIMATAVDAAGANYPTEYAGHSVNPMEGTSLLPVLQGQPLAVRDVGVEHEANRAFYRDQYKFVTKNFDFSDGSSSAHELELYNMTDDPTELSNLAQTEPNKLTEMIEAWNDWAVRVGVPFERLVQTPILLPDPDYSNALFQDLYLRVDNYDIDAESNGMSGSLVPMSYVESFEGAGAESIQVIDEKLQMATGNGMSTMYLDHNFIDSEILNSGGFTVMLDVMEFNSSLTELEDRFGGFGVGLTSAEAASAEDIVVGAYALRPKVDGSGAIALSDFYVDLAMDGILRVWSGNTLIRSILVGRNTGRIKVDFLMPDFSAGSTVIARIYFNEEQQDVVSFNWDHTNQNFIGFSARATNYVRMDNLAILPYENFASGNANLTGGVSINLEDFAGLASKWLTGYTIPCPSADLTGDCFVDLKDLNEMALQWLNE